MRENIRSIEDTINTIRNHRPFFDVHTHILQGVDDGSKSVEESVLILKTLKRQGAYAVVLTPHFRADITEPKEFISKRQAAVDCLKKVLTKDMPRVALGAEVHYFEGISRCEDLKSLAIKGTNLILVEMPFIPWTDRIIKEVHNIVGEQGLIPVIAHIDRYIKAQSKRSLFRLLDSEALVQANAAGFYTSGIANKIKKLFVNGKINFIGSDCHNMAERIPDFDKAAEKLAKSYKEPIVNAFLKQADKLLEKAEFIEV